MDSSITMSPAGMIFTFKQESEESFKEAWARINNYYDNTEPKMTLSLLLSSFYYGLALRYRYALDTVVGGDFLNCDGDQAFNGVKKLIATYSSRSNYDSPLISICARLNTLETSTASLKECYSRLSENYVSTNPEPSSWFPTMKVEINNKTLHARCDIMSEFCLMPKNVYESLNLWKLSEGGEGISLANNVVILPRGIAEGVHTKLLGRMISIDYLVIECAGEGQITLGRSLLKLMGAKIDVGTGTMTFNSPPGAHHIFPKSKGKKGKCKGPTNYGVDAFLFENT